MTFNDNTRQRDDRRWGTCQNLRQRGKNTRHENSISTAERSNAGELIDVSPDHTGNRNYDANNFIILVFFTGEHPSSILEISSKTQSNHTRRLEFHHLHLHLLISVHRRVSINKNRDLIQPNKPSNTRISRVTIRSHCRLERTERRGALSRPFIFIK